MRRSPLLAAALVVTDARDVRPAGLGRVRGPRHAGALAADAPWRRVLLLAGFLTLPAYLRLLVRRRRAA